jgi:hypothetical protein
MINERHKVIGNSHTMFEIFDRTVNHFEVSFVLRSAIYVCYLLTERLANISVNFTCVGKYFKNMLRDRTDTIHQWEPKKITNDCTLHLIIDVIVKHMTLMLKNHSNASNLKFYVSFSSSTRFTNSDNHTHAHRAVVLQQPPSIIVCISNDYFMFHFVGNLIGHLITDILILWLDWDTDEREKSSRVRFMENGNYSIVN